MGGSAVSASWTFRVTTDGVVEFKELLASKGTVQFLMTVIESGKTTGKRHYHGLVVYAKEITKNVFDGMFHRAGFKGNAMYQSKRWDGDHKYIQYMHKEGTPVTHGTILGLKSTDEYRAACEAYKVAHRENRYNRSNRGKDLVATTLELITEELRPYLLPPDGRTEYNYYALSVHELRKRVINMYEAVLDDRGETPSNDYTVVDHINRVCYALKGRSLRDNWKERVLEKLQSRLER